MIILLKVNQKWQLFTVWKECGCFGKRKTKIQPWYIFHTICAITGLSSNNIMHIIRVATYIPFEPKVSIISYWWWCAYFLFFLIMEPWWHLVTLTSFIIRFCLSDSQNSDKIDWLNIHFSNILCGMLPNHVLLNEKLLCWCLIPKWINDTYWDFRLMRH